MVIAAGGTNRFRMLAKTADESADALIAFSLPDGQQTQSRPQVNSVASTRPPRVVRPNRLSEKELKAPGPPLPEGEGKELVARMCTKCHGAAVFSKMRMGRVGWENEIADMVERGAVGTEEEIRKVLDYMAKNFGRDSTPKAGASSDKAR